VTPQRLEFEDQTIDDAPIPELVAAKLVAKAANGDTDAFRAIVDATSTLVYKVALRTVGSQADAEDVVQETYVRAWKRLGSVRDPNAVVGWLCRIARNVSIDLVRSQGRRKALSLDQLVAGGTTPLVEALASDRPIASDKLESVALQAALAALIDQVKEKYRTVLLLREVDGMSYNQIAVALNIPPGTVESRLHRGRKILAKKIERWQQEERKAK